MPERVRYIEHKGVEILFIDWSDATSAEILKTMAEAKRLIALRPLQSIRTLTNVANAHVDRAVTEALRDYVSHNKPYVIAGAVVGLSDLKTVIFNVVNRVTGRALRGMDSIEQAKEWLANSPRS